MFELFKDELDSNTYASVEEYNADVLRISNMLEEELGKTERMLYNANKELQDELGIAIKGKDDEEENNETSATDSM